jgi:hypothetical protein
MEQTRYYRPEKVAELAHCTIQTIYRHLNNPSKEGNYYFPNARRIGKRKWIIPDTDVIQYLGFDPTEENVTIV